MITYEQRPPVDLVIPVQQESGLLESCVKAIEATTKNYRLHIVKEPSLNVGEARQQALNTLPLGRFVCFLDDDSVVQEGWLEPLAEALLNNDRYAVAFAEEQWGSDYVLNVYQDVQPIGYGPAACMLIDRDKIPISVRWNKYIGLKTGWLGGDFEEVEYVCQIRNKNLLCVGVHGSRFIHTDRTTMADYRLTDRSMTCNIMKVLINQKFLTNPDNEDFFRKLRYVPARKDNDRMLAPGHTLKECFYEVLKDNNITHFPVFKEWGLV
jgi:glycosyltransferase involved in cell wall biosynthesis